MSKWPSGSVTSAEVHLRIANNATWQDAFQFGDPDDLTWTLESQMFELDVQRNPYDAVPLLSLSSSENEIVIADVFQRVIYMNVDATAIQGSLSPGVYVYDLVMIAGDNPAPPAVRVPLMHGTLQVVQGVTYPPV
jgi:hypothetical protein